MPTTTSAPSQDATERYCELAALEILISSDLALGAVFQEHLSHLLLEEGIDLRPHDDKPGLAASFSTVMTDEREESAQGAIISAHLELLIARLLRSITPEVIEQSATHFETIAAAKLSDLLDRQSKVATVNA